MRVWITLDHVDGINSKRGAFDLADGISMMELIMMLSQKGMAGITITKRDILSELKNSS